jgi:hypothetical protein
LASNCPAAKSASIAVMTPPKDDATRTARAASAVGRWSSDAARRAGS